MFEWESGRQNGGYEKLKLFSSERFKCDAYLLRMKAGSEIPIHVDPAVAGYEHHRVNLILRKPKQGGTFVCAGTYFESFFGRIIRFRPDIQRHCVTEVDSGVRIVLSFGWLKR